jgi:hypothetical protein
MVSEAARARGGTSRIRVGAPLRSMPRPWHSAIISVPLTRSRIGSG